MKQACEILELLSKTPGRLDKEKILQENKGDEKLKFLFETAFNPYLIYGVKDFETYCYEIPFPTFVDIMLLRKHLLERHVIGNEARECLTKTISCDDKIIIKWLEATFKKNIKCGVDVKTINKVWPNLIPTFDVGLCETFKGEELPLGQWAIEPKMDGLRCVVLIDDQGGIKFLSRMGKELYNLDYIEKEIKELNLVSAVLDGELYGNNWNDTMSVVQSEKNIEGKNYIIITYVYILNKMFILVCEYKAI